jgi:ankyrin repeat protein
VYVAGYSPLHLCAVNGRVEEMNYLIMKGADVNLKVRDTWIELKNHIKTASELVKTHFTSSTAVPILILSSNLQICERVLKSNL